VAPLVEDLLALMAADAGRPHVVLPLAGRRRARRRRTVPAGWCSTCPASTPGSSAGCALDPDADAMDRVNPVYVPRNHLVEEALEAATAGDLAPLHRLLEAVTAPYDERPGLERYAEPAPDSFGDYRTFCGT
jgi:serine/tyrosine/threonine adenylyltransferase